MGALIRLREPLVERRLRRAASKGMGVTVRQRAPTFPELREQLRADDIEPDDVDDVRRLIPAEGLREYWYPALPEAKVRRRKPLFWNMLGDELALFRAQDGTVQAVSDVCPHRGASLAAGRCFYAGTVTCPYHGATFDGEGNCRAFITEGPDSDMPELLSVRSYPTRTLRGWVWIWMGDGEPAPIEHDVPPEFFDDKPSTVVLSTYTYWATNWIVALENNGDAHNAGPFAHRNSMMQLTSPEFVRMRTPFGPRARIVENRAVRADMEFRGGHYANKDGETPFQLYYSGVDGVWPLTRWRRRIWTLLSPWYRYVSRGEWRRKRIERFPAEDEWGGVASGHHLPCASRLNLPFWMVTRYAVPIGPNESRVVYFHTRVIRSRLLRAPMRLWFLGYLNWWYHYNFSTQDAVVASPCRYTTPETLAPTDAQLVVLRRLIAFQSRDAERANTAVDKVPATPEMARG